MWIYVDENKRIIGANTADMDGNSGWVKTACDVPSPLFDVRDIAAYQYDADTDTIKARTQEEMDADYDPPIPAPSAEERITALEEQLAAYEAAYAEGVNEA